MSQLITNEEMVLLVVTQLQTETNKIVNVISLKYLHCQLVHL